MNVFRHKAFADLQPARVVVVLALVATGAFLAEHVRPGHHIHVGPDGPRHHHHAFVGTHFHEAEADAAAPKHAHAHHDTNESEGNDPAGAPPEAPGIQELLTTSALMAPSAQATFTALLTLVPGAFKAYAVAPLARRATRAGGPRAPPRLG